MASRAKASHNRHGHTEKPHFEEVCNPADMALLVYDMQVSIVRQIRNWPQVVARVRDMLGVAPASGMRA